MKVLPLFIAAILLVAGCDGSKQSTKNQNTVWIKTDPIQCLQNPWEKDWLQSSDEAYENYPKGNPRIVEPEEAEIIRAFFEDLGINVMAVDYKSYADDVMVCEACTCPQGFTLYLKVGEKDVEKMKEYDFIIAKEKNEFGE